MKRWLLLISLTSGFAFGQSTQLISVEEYNQLKINGGLDPVINYQLTANTENPVVHYSGSQEKNGVCNCMVPLDSTFILAMQPNDDQYSNLISLPFTFDFYGNTYNSLYINNNGNISFLAQYSTFTANPFPDSSYNMIAPFWGDVDTRDSTMTGNIGNVWYKLTPNALVVVWDHVGYFMTHGDKTNTFQLVISDGTDPLIPIGNNVSFCYSDMQWTTGDASSGSGGFGGVPATVGVNYGNGVDYFQVGRFDQPGTGFDGPYNNSDQIDFLDNMEMYFNVAGASSSNTPPMVIAAGICDTIDVYSGDTLKSIHTVDFTVMVATPEINQTLQVGVTCPAYPNAISVTQTPIGNEFVVVDITFDATLVPPGMYNVLITATDNGTPVATTTKSIPIHVQANTLELAEFENTFSIYPNPGFDKLNIRLNNGKQAMVEVVDLLGNSVYSGEIGSTKSIDIAHLNAGIYVVKVTMDNQVSSTRFIKN
ncbi:nidogen-like domain-containing protein [Fluviicola taffensis]|uniref:nidogen-like domain-containing protein n=1 Tax=Fluviicola taffensis TaxID=191579 RepID=UPI003137C69B